VVGIARRRRFEGEDKVEGKSGLRDGADAVCGNGVVGNSSDGGDATNADKCRAAGVVAR